ncbi:MAG: hypothetical protein CMA84_06670 [Euryarchaeota archaeon]|nr:hypothetical protein [Euryarchaeota archaeon]
MPKLTPRFADQFDGIYILCEPGTFTGKGDSENKKEIAEPFFLGEKPVTQVFWQSIMQSNPSKFQQGFESALRPVESISWHDAQMFCEQLNLRGDTHHFGLDGHWRLPTLDEWVYAALSGNETTWHFGDIEKDLDNYGWHAGNSGAQTKQVGMKKPNDWGFFDMHGLVGEWCENQVKESEKCPVKGGSWFTESESTKPFATRWLHSDKKSDGVGLRLVWSPV